MLHDLLNQMIHNYKGRANSSLSDWMIIYDMMKLMLLRKKITNKKRGG
jgi:hypothetical protein